MRRGGGDEDYFVAKIADEAANFSLDCSSGTSTPAPDSRFLFKLAIRVDLSIWVRAQIKMQTAWRHSSNEQNIGAKSINFNSTWMPFCLRSRLEALLKWKVFGTMMNFQSDGWEKKSSTVPDRRSCPSRKMNQMKNQLGFGRLKNES